MNERNANAWNDTNGADLALDEEPLRGIDLDGLVLPRSLSRPIGCHAHGAKKYPHSTLLASSTGLGWSAISAELRSHRAGDSPFVVSQQAEVCLAIDGNEGSLLRRTAAGCCQEALAATGTIWMIPIGIGEVVTFTGPIPQVLHLYLPLALFDRLSKDFDAPDALAYSIRHDGGIRDDLIANLGASILSELTSQSPVSQVFVQTAALTLAARLLHRYCNNDESATNDRTAQGPGRVWLRAVLDYIAANVRSDITLVDLADIAGYSPYHFSRKFTLAMGVPPHRYIGQLRLEWAMDELTKAALPLAEISLHAQFSSQAAFTRAFRRATGMTPKEYQRFRR